MKLSKDTLISNSSKSETYDWYILNPVSTIALIIGYIALIPLAANITRIVSKQKRIPMVGHQVGLVIVILGWILRRQYIIAAIHVVWLIGIRIWFWLANKSSSN